jgi:hypothetical protein
MNGLDINRQGTTPLRYNRTLRNNVLQGITSFPAGKFVPLSVFHMFREDAVRSGRARITFEMQETAEILVNPVRCDVRAYLIPFLAMERFDRSMDQLNRSYMGVPQVEGGDLVSFIETHARGAAGSNAVYDRLGLHGKSTDQVNTMYLEAYNCLWNFLATNRSADIAKRMRLDGTLAPAFWDHARFAHIKPSFDAARAEGEVALSFVDAAVPLRGVGISSTAVPGTPPVIRSSNGSESLSATQWKPLLGTDFGTASGRAGLSAVYADLRDSGVTISLANIELARKAQWFAGLRERFDGHDDEWIIDMLMNGLTIPDQALTQPVLLAQKSTVFGQAKRYATDAGNLTESATNGATFVDLNIRVPRLHTGGVVMIVAQVVPDQMFERQRDPFFHSQNVEQWPEALRDTLDPQKVVVVKNGEIDTDHSAPNDTFGYAPLNWQWDRRAPMVGGRFLRPTVDAAFDEDRQRFWAVETVDPVLSEDFYICTNIHQKPFLNGGNEEDGWVDVFDAVTLGNVRIEGNTQFGPALIEATDNYDEVMAEAPTDRIESGE